MQGDRDGARDGAGLRILVADSLPRTAIEDLEARGHECVVDSSLGKSDLADHIQGFDVLVVRSTKVTEKVFAVADRLALVIRAGAGTNTIATEAAAARGVLVANVPGRNSAAVAELTMGLLLALDRRIADNVVDLREGRWNKKGYSKAAGVLGTTMGIVGLGSIGLAVAERAAAFGIKVQAVRKPREAYVETRAAELGITLCASLEDLVSSSDIVSLHVPSSPETKHLVDAAFLHLMRPGSILLNTSRGDVVDEDALLAALEDGLRAGLDVYADEPGSGTAEWKSALAQHPNVVGTHHIGASTEQAQLATAAGVVEIVDAFTEGEARNCVNLAPSRLGSVTLTVRHLDRPGVLARVLDVLSLARLNVEHMENRVFRGGEAAMASIDVAGSVPQELLDEIGDIPDVLGVSATTFAGVDEPASVVRPLDARIVRQERAAEHITQMLDALPASERPLDSQGRNRPPRMFNPEAYDESTAALYLYRLRRGEEEHIGVVGEVSADAFVDGQVRGHEAVQPDRVEALVDHFASAPVRSELVALLHALRDRGRRRRSRRAWARSRSCSSPGRTAGSRPCGGFPRTRAGCSPTSSVGACTTSPTATIASPPASRCGTRPGEPAGVGLMCVIYPLDGLRLLSFHRRVTGPVDAAKLLALLSESFELRELADPDEVVGSFGLYLDGRWYDATYLGERLDGAAGLDIAILNDQVLEPLLGIEAPSSRLEFVSALSPLVDVTKACDEDGGVLFALRPPSLEQLTEVADRGEVMPPKTTYFDPKPYAGIFLR